MSSEHVETALRNVDECNGDDARVDADVLAREVRRQRAELRDAKGVNVDVSELIKLARETERSRHVITLALELLKPQCMCCGKGNRIMVHDDACPIARVLNANSGRG